MLNFSFGELMLVFIIGLIFLGPKRFPVIAKTIIQFFKLLKNLQSIIKIEIFDLFKSKILEKNMNIADYVSLNNLTIDNKNKIIKEVDDIKIILEKTCKNNMLFKKKEYDIDQFEILLKEINQSFTILLKNIYDMKQKNLYLNKKILSQKKMLDYLYSDNLHYSKSDHNNDC
ncbi:hypothetical protein [Pantoea sp. SoEX]|uniref:hypothetical protein n=1 Tax=Pantoea sp. SoEX TaxID=2576763 RepID=UPI00135C960F|nr:hypothetical protein [Pantoea sp. SoEX]MXP51405.1 hypothetical protein [Pantoea sp. SoEX]